MKKTDSTTYINTSNQVKILNVTFADKDGNPTVSQVRLMPGQIYSSGPSQIANQGTVTNVELIEDGKVKQIGGVNLSSKDHIIKNSVIFDIETTTKRGAGSITQLATYDLGTGVGTHMMPQANFISHAASGESAISFFHKLSMKSTVVPEGVSFRDLVLIKTYGENFVDPKNRTAYYENVLLGRKETKESIKKKQGKARSKARVGVRQAPTAADIKKEVSKIEKKAVKALAENDKFQAQIFLTPEEAKTHKINIKGLEQKRALAAVSSAADALPHIETLFNNTFGLNTSGVFSELNVIDKKPLRDIIRTDLPDLLNDTKVTWVANAAFESQQIGGQIRADASRSFDALKSAGMLKEGMTEKAFMPGFHAGAYEKQLEILNKSLPESEKLYTKNPFLERGINLTTGAPFTLGSRKGEFALERARALKTGDYSKLYEAMLRDTRAGDTRDIIDLVRMAQSKLKNVGALDIEKPIGLSMEVQGRFFNVLQQMRLAEEAGSTFTDADFSNALHLKEPHIGIGDTVVEEKVFRESFDILDAMSKVESGDKAAEDLIKQAQKGKGAYFRALMLGAMQQEVNKHGLTDALFEQRAGRLLIDLSERGYFERRRYKPGIGKNVIAKGDSGIVLESSAQAAKSSFDKAYTMDELYEELEGLSEYKNADKEGFIKRLKNDVSEYIDSDGFIKEDQKDAVRKLAFGYEESASGQIKAVENLAQSKMSVMERQIKLNLAGGIPANQPVNNVNTVKPKQNASLLASSAKEFLEEGAETTLRSTLKKGAIGMAAIGAAFATISAFQEKRERISYTAPSYTQFLKSQAEFYGNDQTYIDEMRRKYGTSITGMQTSELAESLRRTFTDFGSPYQGPGFSLSVLQDHQLRRERQRYEQGQFNSEHFSVDGGVGFQLRQYIDSMFKKELGTDKSSQTLFFNNYRQINPEEYGSSLKGEGLIEYSVDPSKISVEDADTITVSRGGNVNSALSGFMGTEGQENMSFRLAGIDAPETAHGDRPAQPYAEEAKAIAKQILANAKEVKIVSRKGDTTYGRQVGMVYVDGKNLNLELLRRGAAAYLPYKGKGKSQIYDPEAFEQAQKVGQDSKRGMWRTGFFQAYKLISEQSNKTITFNTLANVSKVAQNTSLMTTYSLMKQAESMGFVNSEMQMEISDFANQLKKGGSQQSVFAPDLMRNSFRHPDLQNFQDTKSSMSGIDTQMKMEIAKLYKSRGSKLNSEVLSTRKATRNNISLSKDSLKVANVNWNSEKESRLRTVLRVKDDRIRRLKAMEEMQQAALRNQFNSPIAHHRM